MIEARVMWTFSKTLLVEVSGISKDALHVHIGLIIFFGATYLLKRSIASWVPWMVVLGLDLLNEAMDLFVWRGDPGIAQWGGSFRDLLNTILWPTILVAPGFVLRALNAQQIGPPNSSDPIAGEPEN